MHQNTLEVLNRQAAQPTSALGQLLTHVKRLKTINRTLQTCLEPPLNYHCRVANATADRLVLHADSPIWLTKLRYALPEIRERLRNTCELPPQCQIQLRVQPCEPTFPDPPIKHRLYLSAPSAALIRDAALSIENPKLQKALLRLTRHAPLAP